MRSRIMAQMTYHLRWSDNIIALSPTVPHHLSHHTQTFRPLSGHLGSWFSVCNHISTQLKKWKMTNIPKQDRVISTFFKWTNPSPWSIWSKNVVKVYYWSKIFLSKLCPIYYILYIKIIILNHEIQNHEKTTRFTTWYFWPKVPSL